jgi:hypothetical protein
MKKRKNAKNTIFYVFFERNITVFHCKLLVLILNMLKIVKKRVKMIKICPFFGVSQNRSFLGPQKWVIFGSVNYPKSHGFFKIEKMKNSIFSKFSNTSKFHPKSIYIGIHQKVTFLALFKKGHFWHFFEDL